MNLTEFMKKADKLAMGMPAEKLAAFLHDYVRSVPEYKREDFLERLSFFADKEAGLLQFCIGTDYLPFTYNIPR